MSHEPWTKLQSEHKKAFIPFVVVGYPDVSTSQQMVDTLIAEGADLIELGVPFSDPVADGPVIQAASEKASRSTSLADVLAFAQDCQQRHSGFPFILFTYYNPILKMGIVEVAQQAKHAGVYAVLVVDLPPEEAESYIQILQQAELRTVFLMSPTTSPERMEQISQASTGFIYYVSRVGVTGTREHLSQSLGQELALVRQATSQPVAVGFGISTGEQARHVAHLADAVVVGSAFVKCRQLDEVKALAREMAIAIHGA